MTSLRLAARIAARESRRRPFRSLLVIALVAVPVFGMTTSTSLIRSEHRSPIERWDDEFGRADAALWLPSVNEVSATNILDDSNDDASSDSAAVAAAIDDQLAEEVAAIEARLPEGATTVVNRRLYRPIRDEHHLSYADFVETDLTSPVYGDVFRSGVYLLTDGRLPEVGGEVALSPRMADKFDVGVGDRFDLVRPDIEPVVVGIVEDTNCVRCERVYGDVDAVGELSGWWSLSAQLLVDMPGTGSDLAAQVAGLVGPDGADGGGQFRPIPELQSLSWYDTGDDTTASLRWSIVIGALALAVVGIVIAAAFAVGARRQLVLLGQLSANGATEAVRRRTLVLQGTVTGAVGSLVGIGAGVALMVGGQGWLEQNFDRRLDGIVFSALDVVVIFAVGTLGATIAARIPAMSAARISTLHALAGRRPLGRVRHGLTVAGLVAMGAGLACFALATLGARDGQSGNVWAGVAILGGLGVLLGSTALTPAMVARIEPLSAQAQGSLRVAARSLGRNRTRTGAVIAAVAAAGSLAIGGSTAIGATELSDYTSMPSDLAVVSEESMTADQVWTTGAPAAATARRIGELLPDAALVETTVVVDEYTVTGLDAATGYGFGATTALIVDERLAATMQLGRAARAALAEDGAVIVAYDKATRPGRAELDFGPSGTVEADVVFSRKSLDSLASGIYVTPETVSTLGLSGTPGPLVIDNGTPFSEVEGFELDLLRDEQYATASRTGVEPESYVEVRRGYDNSTVDRRTVEFILVGVSVFFALLVVAIGLALAAADDRDEREILSVAGAPPSMLARVAGAKAWVLATLGFLLAIPVGYLPVLTVLSTDRTEQIMRFPVGVVAILLVAAPVVAGSIALGGSSLAQRIRPVRVSTATFD